MPHCIEISHAKCHTELVVPIAIPCSHLSICCCVYYLPWSYNHSLRSISTCFPIFISNTAILSRVIVDNTYEVTFQELLKQNVSHLKGTATDGTNITCICIFLHRATMNKDGVNPSRTVCIKTSFLTGRKLSTVLFVLFPSIAISLLIYEGYMRSGELGGKLTSSYRSDPSLCSSHFTYCAYHLRFISSCIF